jgi:broad specificity phosphatase PhoE
VPRVEIVLARHGETAWSRDRLHTSNTDLPLTDAGRQEAVALARRLKGREFALVLSSPLRRARETCELAGLADEAEVDGDLREFDYGEFEGISTAEIRSKRPGWELWRDGCPGGETAADVGDRADRVIERALSTDGDVALFAHGHFLRVLGARWIGLPGAHGANLLLATAALCVLGFEREHRALSSWNDIGHLS